MDASRLGRGGGWPPVWALVSFSPPSLAGLARLHAIPSGGNPAAPDPALCLPLPHTLPRAARPAPCAQASSACGGGTLRRARWGGATREGGLDSVGVWGWEVIGWTCRTSGQEGLAESRPSTPRDTPLPPPREPTRRAPRPRPPPRHGGPLPPSQDRQSRMHRPGSVSCLIFGAGHDAPSWLEANG